MHPTVHPVDLGTTEPVDLTPADALRGTAGYLRRHGWTQHDYVASGLEQFPAACVVGAIGIAAYGYATSNPYGDYHDHAGRRLFGRAVDFFDDHVVLHHDPSRDDMVSGIGWNDDPRRTAEQVIAALEAAADDWDRTHGGAR